MNKTVVVLVAVGVLVVGGVGVWWYMGQSREPAAREGGSETMPVPTGGVVEEKEVVAAGEVKEFVVEGSEFKFSLAEIRVKRGDTVRVTLKNAGKFPHDFVIDEFEVATSQINPGDEEEVEFAVDKAGTFEYYCSVGNHRAQGMVGELVVE